MSALHAEQLDIAMYQFHVADDHPLFRNAMLNVLGSHFPQASISESSDLDETIEALTENTDIDLLFLDINMPGSQDLFGLVSIRKNFPGIPVVIVSAWQDQDIISRSLGHGASGYIPKSLASESIADAIQTVLDGSLWAPAGAAVAINQLRAEELDLAERMASLTPQQYKVLCALRDGALNKQIAYEMGITEATIKAHVTAIFRKLGVSNRTQAVIKLNKMAIQSPEP